MSLTTEESYRWCRSFSKNSGSNFVRTFSLLRPDKAKSMYVVYAFARIVDDIGDAGDHQNRRLQLEHWRAWLGSLGSKEPADESELQENLRPAFEHSIQRYAIPMDWFDQLLDGIEGDLDEKRCIRDWQELERYCFQVAGTMGLVCIKIWGGDLDSLRERAEACGIAFQCTNILRDVYEDASRGRIFIPQEELMRFGVDPQDWLKLRPTGDWQGLLKKCASKAVASFEHARTLGLELEFDGQRMFSLMWHSYLNLLREVVRNLSTTFEQRNLRVPSWKKFSHGLIHFLAPLYLAARPLHRPIDIPSQFPGLVLDSYEGPGSPSQADSMAARAPS